MPRDILSEQQINIEFVKEVQKHPTLYNFELPTYTRKDITDKAWQEVGNATDLTPSECREKWRNLRAVFMRTIKGKPPRTGKKKPYYLADAMHFVVPYMRPLVIAEANKEKEKQAQVNEAHQTGTDTQVQKIKIEDEEDLYEVSMQGFEEQKDHKKKRPAQDDEHRETKKAAKSVQPSSSVVPGATDIDHVKSFINSLMPELTEMNSAQFKNFKRRVLILIDDITADVPASPKHTDDSDSEYII